MGAWTRSALYWGEPRSPPDAWMTLAGAGAPPGFGKGGYVSKQNASPLHGGVDEAGQAARSHVLARVSSASMALLRGITAALDGLEGEFFRLPRC